MAGGEGIGILGVPIAGSPHAADPRDGGTLEFWEAGGVAGLETAEGSGFQGCHPVEIGWLCIRAWFGSCL